MTAAADAAHSYAAELDPATATREEVIAALALYRRAWWDDRTPGSLASGTIAWFLADFLPDWLSLMFYAPLGDNHHNAAACPYCGDLIRKASIERDWLRETIWEHLATDLGDDGANPSGYTLADIPTETLRDYVVDASTPTEAEMRREALIARICTAAYEPHDDLDGHDMLLVPADAIQQLRELAAQP